jgi:hypothetical protein
MHNKAIEVLTNYSTPQVLLLGCMVASDNTAVQYWVQANVHATFAGCLHACNTA